MKSKKDKIIKARVTEEDYLSIKHAITASGLSESEFLRRAAKRVEISGSNADHQKAMVHICQIQTLLNQARLKTDDPMIDAIQEEVSVLCQCLL